MDDVSMSLKDEDEDEQLGPWRRALNERNEMGRMIITLEKRWKRMSGSRRDRRSRKLLP